MAGYNVEMNRTASATLSIGSWVADATRPRRLKLYELLFGSEATPANVAFLLQVGRITAAGTNTSVTPNPNDPADAATESDCGENQTVDCTYTAGQTILSVPINAQSTFRWVAVPGRELVGPATASNGFGFKTPTMTAQAITATAYVEEQ
jgi:hypothetical protein